MKRRIWLVAILLTLISFYLLDHDGALRMAMQELSANISTSGLILISLLYALLLAIPFVAGIEIGICLMCLFGLPGIFAAYFGTILGLSLSYFIGKRIGRFYKLKQRDIQIVRRIRGLSLYVPRWLSLALLINTPGNAIMGGGGGITMAFGMERHLSNAAFIIVILLATLPVPLLVYFGFIQFIN